MKIKEYIVIEKDEDNFRVRGQFKVKANSKRKFKTKDIIIGQALETCAVGESVMIRI